MKELYNKKFSIGHWDSTPSEDLYLRCFENSSEQYKNEIYDIYYGATFYHSSGLRYGNTMGVDASEAHYKNLLTIQEKYGIPISLTINEMNRPMHMLRPDITKDFVDFIGKYYADGVRSCTISHTHLMRLGVLQETFPEMDWKNTVNHGIRTTQQFIDYANLGYTTVQLDRDFNRNRGELRKVKKEADRLGIKTCLLVFESCLPECPFKTEHDCWQSGELAGTGHSYWGMIGNTCVGWRNELELHSGPDGKHLEPGVTNPRTSTDLIIHSNKDWDEFAELVDIFKLSGRLKNLDDAGQGDKLLYAIETKRRSFSADSFKTIYENNLAPLHMWFSISCIKKDFPTTTDIDEIKDNLNTHFWNSKEAIKLAKVLKNCKNQCYKCHMCDDVFGTKRIDSVLEV